MKNTLATVFAVAALSLTAVGAASAGDLKDTTYKLNVLSGPLDFSVSADNKGATNLEVGVTAFDHKIGVVDANARFALGAPLNAAAGDVYVRGEYNANWKAAPQLDVYGQVGVQYNTTSNFKKGNTDLDMYVGTKYTFNSEVAVFGELGQSWNASSKMASNGAYAQIGVPFTPMAMSNMTITPSVIHTFNKPATKDMTRLNLDLTFRF